MKTVIVGFGSIGKRHFQNLSVLLRNNVLVCTEQNISDRIPTSQKFSSIDDCIKEKPNVGFITNITNAHIRSATKLAKAGCHIFIEKPLSNSITGIEKLLKITTEKNLITMVGCNMRFHPCLLTIKKLISIGKIGKVLSVCAENGSYLPDWHPNENYANSYAARKELGGGVILTCIHEIDYLHWLFGDIQEVLSISAKVSNLNINSEDLSCVIFRFKNNIIGELHLDYFQRPRSRTCKIIGTNGTIFWDFNKNIVKLYDVKTKKWKNIVNLQNYNLNSMYMEEIRHFLDCIKKKKKTINDLNDGFKVLQIAMAILKSSTTKQFVRL